MSAESQSLPRHCGGHIVSPQPMSDKSIIESVAGFINDVVPQGYSSGPIVENKEQITWARFEYGDINDPVLYPDSRDDRNNTAPLLLVLGYGSGVQVWAIPASGEATEVLSWRQGTVRTLRVLPTPDTDPSSNADIFAHKRPLVALCDSSSPGAQYCSVSFISLSAGDQVKSIKFKNPVNDVLANRRSVIVTFSERIAVFDALTLEDRLTITTCYPSPGANPNPVALGSRWLAYAERRLIPSKRCSGGTEGEGVQSYTATVLHAAKSLGKGLRELGETVASSLTGNTSLGSSSRPGLAGSMGGTGTGNAAYAAYAAAHGQGDAADLSLYPGVVTIIDARGTSSSSKENGRVEDNVVAHFTAHGEAIVALQFDPSGMLLLTADKRGHDFHLFRIQPHPGGSSLAAVHHLYVLHRGDTTAKVQDIAFASDSRWVAVSTLRGTTHVFPITPYGGSVGLRTHSTPHVVNRLSRFHRSAGLSADGRNSPQPVPTQPPDSPVSSLLHSQSHSQSHSQAGMPYSNPRLPPYPHPTTVFPLAQIRQMANYVSMPSSPNPSHSFHRNPTATKSQASRNQSSSEETTAGITLRVSACFAPSRAWLVGSPTVIGREGSNRASKKPVESLFVMACHGNLVEYQLDTKHATGIPKEKVCDNTAIELEVHSKARWLLMQVPHSAEVQPPLATTNPLMVAPSAPRIEELQSGGKLSSDESERWLSHVEIVTHAGPHRRLWMGPQFTFKTYTTANTANTGVSSSLLESECVEIGCRLTRSNPVNMPVSNTRPVVPFVIESGSAGSYEQSPRLVELCGGSTGDSDSSMQGVGETQLREELADAMMESPGRVARDAGRRVIVELRSQTVAVEKIVNPVGSVLTVVSDESDVVSDQCTAGQAGQAGQDIGLDGHHCVGTAVRWPITVVAQLPAAHCWLGKEMVEETPPASNSDGIEARRNKVGPKSADKANRSPKPPSSSTERLPNSKTLILKEKTGEKTPRQQAVAAAMQRSARVSVDVEDPATRVSAEIAQSESKKTEEELATLPPPLPLDMEHLTNEESSCILEEDNDKPLGRVSKSKLYALDVAENVAQDDLLTEISCEADADADVHESDPVVDCEQERNKSVSLTCSTEDNGGVWTASMEKALSSLDFIEPTPPKLWSRECEKMIDVMPPTWPDVEDRATTLTTDGIEDSDVVDVVDVVDLVDLVDVVNTSVSNQDTDTLSLLQASKKNKKKNKRRR